jgi:2-polyprenyl-6-methoxyphenol hydroxylase-like FAD-dependent oxidoreductase
MVLIIGAGIGGLTLGLLLERAGIPCRVYEAATDVRALGVGINIMPNATKTFASLGLQEELSKVAVTTAEGCFFNRYGQLIYREPLGQFAGYEFPQFSIHRGDLQTVLSEAFRARAGADHLLTAWRCTGFEQDDSGVTAHFENPKTREKLPPQRGVALIGCDGIHSVIRKQLHPDDGDPRYSGVNMWRGVTRWKPFLSGASFMRAGWFSTGKLVSYPIRTNIDAENRQLVNWVVELETPKHKDRRDWNRPGQLEDFIKSFEDWHFDWLDVPSFLRSADLVLEFPMVDKDPLNRWTFGRATLLGDAAHPMYPRGSNGAGQAILDGRALSECLSTIADPVEALKTYEQRRLGPTTQVVLTNRNNPPDAILREVYLRTGDKPFQSIDDVISREDLVALSEGYKKITSHAQ